MNPKLTSPDFPLRTALAAFVKSALRRAISKGTWKEFLPTERRLCEIIQVSRPTLRIALHSLAKEGVLRITPGQGTKLLHPPEPKVCRRSRLIAVLTHQPVIELGLTYQGINEMSSQLARHGFDTELLVCRTRGCAARRYAETYLRKNDVFCCILLSVGEPMQRWFSTHSVPALVLGSCHPQIALPSLDFNNRLVCRHAVGIFIQHGHRRLAFLVPDSGLAGDLEGERGFCEAIKSHSGGDHVEGRVVHHDGTARSITRKIDLILSGSKPVTGILIANTDDTFVVIMHLLEQGISVPNQVSLIARDHNRIFEVIDPPAAHYKPEPGAFEHRLSRLMLQMVNQGFLDPKPNLILPKFFPGGTIRKLN